MKTHTNRLLALMLVIAGSVWSAQAEDINRPVEGPSDVAANLDPAPAPYKLNPGDLIYIKVFQEDDLSSTLRIGEDGTIIFPLIGTVKLGGVSVSDATQEIYQKLNAKYLVNPQITLTVLSYSERQITVLGQVQKPGAYNLKERGGMDLLEAIGLAGGFTRLANTGRVLIRREGETGKATVFTVDANKLARDGGTAPFQVMAGDTITIQERAF
jgi:polysaccharide export outer membrane protein